ncbi:MAG: hypothetical protein QOH06_5876 [Acidobacteriota bacterium]|jgi:hypothetical protein|nr:hypothetical protein [Acidobacteriota bacterium]
MKLDNRQTWKQALFSHLRSDWLRQSWKQVFFSYLHKAVLLAAAWASFAALNWLGDQKTSFDEQVEIRWRMADTVGAEVLPYCTKEDRVVRPGYATREEAIQAVQERAEACEWKRFIVMTRPIKAKIIQLARSEKLTEEDSKRLASYYGRIEKEEAYARSRAAAARKRVAGRLLNGGLHQEKPQPDPEENELQSKVFPTLDEHSGSHVIYQLLWYGSLIFGLAASTLLGVLILTILPITDGQGYWTQRLGQIFDRIPGTAGRTLAAPLLAATLGAGTLAGTVADTQAGGQARTTVDQRTYTTAPTSIENPTGYTWLTTNYEGDQIVSNSWPTAEPPGLEDVTKPLGEIEKTVRELMQKAGNVENIVRDITTVNTNVGNIAEATDARLANLEGSVQDLHATSGYMLACLHDLQPVIEKVEDVEELVDWHAEDSTLFAVGVSVRERQQENISKASLTQSAEVDTRNAFKRNFLWTVYKVGPLVPGIMNERLAGDPEQKKFVNALKAMQNEPPTSSRGFRRLLQDKLKEQDLDEQKCNDLVGKYFLSLRKVSTLARR